MNSLPKPVLKESATEIFELCVSGFTDKSLKKKLLSCSSYIKTDSSQFILADFDCIFKIEKNRKLPSGITTKQMKKVYTEKFVPIKSPGRIYYDLILSSPKGGKCPICGERMVNTLDHYMPQSVYTTLIVTPENLIPTCRDCNFDKRAFISGTPEDAPLHPYFDNVDDEIWLSVQLLPKQAVIYGVNCPASWTQILSKRVEHHLALFKLDEFYGSKAGQEIADEINAWKEIENSNGKDELLEHLKMRSRSIEKNHLNSWKAALYRGFVDQFDELLKWLL